VVGLELGADELRDETIQSPRARCASEGALATSRTWSTLEKPLEIGALKIDPAAYRVTRAGKPVQMSTLEFRLLYFLAARPNRVFTRDQLLDAVWGTERFVTPRSVDVYVRRLREKIETDPQHPGFMKTIRGAGYLFETTVRARLFWRLGLTYLVLLLGVLIAVDSYSARVVRSHLDTLCKPISSFRCSILRSAPTGRIQRGGSA